MDLTVERGTQNHKYKCTDSKRDVLGLGAIGACSGFCGSSAVGWEMQCLGSGHKESYLATGEDKKVGVFRVQNVQGSGVGSAQHTPGTECRVAGEHKVKGRVATEETA